MPVTPLLGFTSTQGRPLFKNLDTPGAFPYKEPGSQNAFQNLGYNF